MRNLYYFNPYYSYTPRHWEFGFGFYVGRWFENAITGRLTKAPSEVALLIGPFSFCVEFGKHQEIM